MRKLWIALVLVAAFCGSARADCLTTLDGSTKEACFTNCRGVEVRPFTVTKATDMLCYEWDEGAHLTNDDSGPITISTPSALLDFDPDRTAAGASVATINFRRCAGGWPGSCNANLCAVLTNAALDGTEGAAGTQNKSVRVGPGVYCVDLVVLPGAADDPIVEVKGE